MIRFIGNNDELQIDSESGEEIDPKKPQVKINDFAKNIIKLYWNKKKMRFDNKQQIDWQFIQDRKNAKELAGAGFSIEQIEKSMNYCVNEYPNINWNLGTVKKAMKEVIKHD